MEEAVKEKAIIYISISINLKLIKKISLLQYPRTRAFEHINKVTHI